jgi:hypothetical protein
MIPLGKMKHFEYESNMLNCHGEDDGCTICRFLNGDRTQCVMMGVIEAMDAALANSEASVRLMGEAVVKMAGK